MHADDTTAELYELFLRQVVFGLIAQGATRDDVPEYVSPSTIDSIEPNGLNFVSAIKTRLLPEYGELFKRELEIYATLLSRAPIPREPELGSFSVRGDI
jgi:hypothetical protein